jgi:phosphatidylserine/phosphatidylglycerophosphate/cardiolipin synthase-like enzyme
VAGFGAGAASAWHRLGLEGIDAEVTFSPHAGANAVLRQVADDIQTASSSVFYSLAFLAQTAGPILDAVEAVTGSETLFVYGMSDRKVGGLSLHKPDGNIAPVFPSALSANVPPPFSKEPTGGGGIRMHHKFVVVDFNTAAARVYFGSYNFSTPADRQNGENLLLVRDARVATAYMIEALRIFDHYHFRVASDASASKGQPLTLARPPRAGQAPWWREHYVNPVKVRDRQLFA